MKPKTLGLRHLALFVTDLEACVQFYVERFGMEIVWQPDEDNVYLSSGSDNLALHRADPNKDYQQAQRLDHLGFFLEKHEHVDIWYQDFVEHDIEIAQAPKTHRDNARSFYCRDPDGNLVQVISI